VTRAVIRFAVLSSIAAVVLVATNGGTGEALPVGPFMATVTGLAAIEALRWMRIATGADATPTRSLLTRREPPDPPRPMGLLGLEALVDSACLSGRAARVRLQPRLRDVARYRLAQSRGIDLDREPERAAAAVGPEAWTILAPPTGPIPDPDDAGVALATIAATVAALEAL
jgi:hypothetical protein